MRDNIIVFIVGVLLSICVWLWIFSMKPISPELSDFSVSGSVIPIEASGHYFLVRVDGITKAFFCAPVEGSGVFEVLFYLADVKCTEVTMDEYRLMR